VIQNRAFKQGVTVVEVDAYKTSQVEYGTEIIDKHPLSQREWISPVTGKVIDRDHNAAKIFWTGVTSKSPHQSENLS
jgi:putative transposase